MAMLKATLPTLQEYPSEVSGGTSYEELFEGIVLWPRGTSCCGRCFKRLGGIPLRFVDPKKELVFRQQQRQHLTNAMGRIGRVALVAHILAVMADLSTFDLTDLNQANVNYLSCLSLVAILSLMQIVMTIPEACVPILYTLAAISLMLTTRSRAAFLAGMDVVEAFGSQLSTAIGLCSLSSDAILIGNFACLIVIYFVVLPARAAVSLWCVPFFPLTYLALSVPAPQADGNMARKLNLSFRIFICAMVGLLGRCWIEIGERASFLRLEQVHKDLTKEKILRAVAEHEIERGPFSSSSTPNSNLSNSGPLSATAPVWDDAQSGVTSGLSRPLSSIVFTPKTRDAAPVAMQLKAMKAMAAEEKWLIDWADITFESTLLGKGGFALVLQGHYAGSKVAVKLPLGDQLNTTAEVLDFCGKELRVLRRLRHPSIVTFYGACIEESRSIVLIVEEFVPGLSLFDAILHRDSPELSEGKRREILEILCQALVYLHDQGPSMLHGDLSPKNVLLRSGSLTPVLVDFGMSVLRKSHQKMSGGSPQWMAPELLGSLEAGGLRPDCSLDMFSFGRIAFFVSAKKLPLPKLSIEQLMEMAKTPEFVAMSWPEERSDLQRLCQERICPQCLESDPRNRSTAEETLTLFRTPRDLESRSCPSWTSVLQAVEMSDVRSGYLSTINASMVERKKKTSTPL